MDVSAVVRNAGERHGVEVPTYGRATPLAVAAKAAGGGSGVSGGEFLMLALAACYCDDLHREAALLGLALKGVEVEASDVRYPAAIAAATASPAQVAELVHRIDAITEIHNTLRAGVPVTLVE